MLATAETAVTMVVTHLAATAMHTRRNHMVIMGVVGMAVVVIMIIAAAIMVVATIQHLAILTEQQTMRLPQMHPNKQNLLKANPMAK